MSDKKHHKEKESKHEEVNEPQAEAVATPENGEQLAAEIEALKRQVEDAEAKLAESVQGWQRSAADFQNYKKRIERDNELMYASMKGDIIKKILPALDDLERALQNRPADDAWANGIELITRKLQNILNVEGLKRIEAEGAAFDPNFHEAISHEHNEDFESGHVIAVVQNGYMLGERVIRPALVRVAQ
ncbi:MAG: nucleotide exchange factor GrpE [Anaerolineae bacterium]|nr:nucleotide exchange factor GrpE [Anaerolineae bacterium]MCI0609006.1 nucleotide exchange factor GrpE [Anaerolineae bacterium]